MPVPLYLVETARRARKSPTPAQRRVWLLLSGPEGPRWRQQHPAVIAGRPMVLDFCSLRAKLVVETGVEPMELERRRHLEDAGYRVLWLSNEAAVSAEAEELLRAFVAG